MRLSRETPGNGSPVSPVADGVTPVVTSAAAAMAPAVHAVTPAPLVQTAAAVLGPVTGAVAPVVGSTTAVLAPVTASVAPLLSVVTQPLAPVTASVAPFAATVTAPLETAAAPLTAIAVPPIPVPVLSGAAAASRSPRPGRTRGPSCGRPGWCCRKTPTKSWPGTSGCRQAGGTDGTDLTRAGQPAGRPPPRPGCGCRPGNSLPVRVFNGVASGAF